MKLFRLAAFSYQGKGGNPAGVAICEQMPSDKEMLKIAREIGYSETAFLQPAKDGWQIRYFSPELEVPFCGHATIASGSVLGESFGTGSYKLYLNESDISVSVSSTKEGVFTTTLQSPPTWSAAAPQEFVAEVLDQFNFSGQDLDPRFPVSFAFAGAKHLAVILQDRTTLADMSYNFKSLKSLMLGEQLITINLLWAESSKVFHSRNPFPPGGVYEDPATGAAAAALAGYLRDISWSGANMFEVFQGEDMGSPSHLLVECSSVPGEGVNVTGETRHIS
jgi:PhzF family phenazine biosynthesis protein